jgi:carboxypeptidase C (cathepsin A)
MPNWQFNEMSMEMPETASLLAVQMRRFPSLKVFLAMGRYDLVCPPESALAALDVMDVPKDRLANIEAHMYDGGHMMFTNPEAARKLCEDLSAWMTATMR